MAKNNYKMNVNQYSNQAEQIRKAKGNPNKNIHAKKKNSNYGGYSTSAGSYMAQKLAERGKQQRHQAVCRLARAVAQHVDKFDREHHPRRHQRQEKASAVKPAVSADILPM